MLDLVNLNIGGGPLPKRGSSVNVRRTNEITSVTLPKAPTEERTKYARRVARLFDTADLDAYGVADALWDVSSDGVKRNIYALVDALLDVAADRAEQGRDYTIVERNVAGESKGLRDHLRLTGYIEAPEENELLNYLSGLDKG